MRKIANQRTRKPRAHAAERKAATGSASAKRAASLGNAGAASARFSGGAWSFDGVLRRVLGFSRAAETATAGKRGALDALGLFVRTLDQGTRDKLETVMRAGRDGRALAEANALLAQERVAPGYEAPELFHDGATSLQDLQRGHAVACATAFDLEVDLKGWSPAEGRQSLDDRVWLRFGREVALSSPGEWSCLGLVNSKKELLALFLRRGEQRWWSFDWLIDRPSSQQMARRRKARASDHGRLVALPLDALVARRCPTDRKALRRAALAVSARLGRCRIASDDSSSPS